MVEECHVCHKAVYHAEKVIGPGGTYHRSCLKCIGCGKILTQNNLKDHKKEAYCQVCYTQLYRLEPDHFGSAVKQKAGPGIEHRTTNNEPTSSRAKGSDWDTRSSVGAGLTGSPAGKGQGVASYGSGRLNGSEEYSRTQPAYTQDMSLAPNTSSTNLRTVDFQTQNPISEAPAWLPDSLRGLVETQRPPVAQKPAHLREPNNPTNTTPAPASYGSVNASSNYKAFDFNQLRKLS